MDIELLIERVMDAFEYEEALEILFDDPRVLTRAKYLFEDLYEENVTGEAD